MATICKAIIPVLAGQFVARASIAASACTAASGEKTTALVELYASEGCSSCPPADGRNGHVLQAAACGLGG